MSIPDDDGANVLRLLALGIDSSAADRPVEPGSRFGDYELAEVLGRGGMGVVYRARHVGIHREVALKLIRSGELASESDVLRFRAEAAANLDHPNIVPVYHFGERDGQPFFTMRLLPGGNLARALADSRPTPRRAATLLVTIARAVHHAHERGVLHRDLKPTNILLDDRGQPYVADFGIARRLDERSNGGPPKWISGHPDYMAPEQALGEPGGLTVAADVYGLGVILYEMLTGGLPERGPTYEQPIVRPSAIDDRVPPDLDLVCLRCLERAPERRYASAHQLADDLERCLRGELPAILPGGRGARLWWRVRRHPFLATVLAGAIFVSLASAWITFRVVQSNERALQNEVLQVNLYAAQAIADQVLFKLHDLSDQLTRCADDPRVVSRIRAGLLALPDSESSERTLMECGATSRFDSVRLFDTKGVGLTRYPLGQIQPGLDFSFREYFRGARRLGELERRAVHVGRAIRSEADGQFKIPLAAPVFSEGTPIGVVLATIGTDSTLASLALPTDTWRRAVLIGLRDRERSESELPEQNLLLVHPALSHGEAIAVEGPDHDEIGQTRTFEPSVAESPGPNSPPRVFTRDDHVDPLLEGRWLAGFARVGTTSYTVIVQTREGATKETIHRRVGELVAASGGLFALGMTVVLFAGWILALRRQRALR